MTAPPASPSPLQRLARFLPAGRGWWLVLGAILAGLLLFALVLSNKRDEFEFHRAGEAPAGVPGQVFEPLPAPLPAGESGASGMDDRPPARDEAPRIDQQAQSPVPLPSAQPPAADAVQAPPDAGPRMDAGVPRPISTPSPEYPSAALRARASGDVVLRIEVGTDGRPSDVAVVGSSRNRALDRAAVQTVRRWRFEPALRDGVPVPATVQQVIRFEPPS